MVATEKGRAIARAALRRSSGGGEIRTPVLHKIFRDIYVRSPRIDVSSRWLVGHPRLDEPPGVSPVGGRRAAGLARICVT